MRRTGIPSTGHGPGENPETPPRGPTPRAGPRGGEQTEDHVRAAPQPTSTHADLDVRAEGGLHRDAGHHRLRPALLLRQRLHQGVLLHPQRPLGFVQGVVANSSSAVFVPLCLLLGGGLIAFLVLGRLGLALAGPGRTAQRRKAIRWLLATGAAMVVAGFPTFFTNAASLFPPGRPGRFVPALVVIVGATPAVFAVQLRLTEVPGLRVRQAREADRMWLASGTLALGLLTLSLFYGMALYVAYLGRGDAMLHADEGHEGIRSWWSIPGCRRRTGRRASRSRTTAPTARRTAMSTSASAFRRRRRPGSTSSPMRRGATGNAMW